MTTPFLEGNAGRKMQGIAQPMVTTVDDQHQVLAFLMAAPADIDTLLAMVERLTERVQFLSGQYQVGWDEAMRTVTAYANPERDYVELAAAKEEVTAQATDLAYLRSYIHALERYVPEASRRVAAGDARAALEQQGEGV